MYDKQRSVVLSKIPFFLFKREIEEPAVSSSNNILMFGEGSVNFFQRQTFDTMQESDMLPPGCQLTAQIIDYPKR